MSTSSPRYRNICLSMHMGYRLTTASTSIPLQQRMLQSEVHQGMLPMPPGHMCAMAGPHRKLDVIPLIEVHVAQVTGRLRALGHLHWQTSSTETPMTSRRQADLGRLTGSRTTSYPLPRAAAGCTSEGRVIAANRTAASTPLISQQHCSTPSRRCRSPSGRPCRYVPHSAPPLCWRPCG